MGPSTARCQDRAELLSQYRMPIALNIDVMSLNDTLDSILFHCDLTLEREDGNSHHRQLTSRLLASTLTP